MTDARSPDNPALEDAFYALAVADSILDAELLDLLVRQLPQHATELTEFAVELALDELDDFTAVAAEEPECDVAATSPTVHLAMSRFRGRLGAVRRQRVRSAAAESNKVVRAVPSAPPPNPLAQLNRDDFRAFASSLGGNILFAAKLRDRQIDPGTISSGFVRCVAEKLGESEEVVSSHFSAPPQSTAAISQYFKASAKPAAETRQSLADAVRDSGLTEKQQRLLLDL